MNKEEIYFKYALLPEEDGTFSDYYMYYIEHPQKDPEVLKRACKEFSEFVRFCMDISVRYKSKNHNKYLYAPYDESDELDRDNYKIRLFGQGETIFPDTDLQTINYPNIEGLIKMWKLENSYRGIFRRLLRGESFLH